MPNPVVFLPGYYGSRLSDRQSGTEVWLNGAGIFSPATILKALHFDPDDPNRLVPTAILDEVDILPLISPNVYKGVLKFLRENVRAPTLGFWYDWRQSIFTEADRLHGQIGRLLSEHGASKVNLVAHSLGALVARAYFHRHGGQAIDHFITLGAPHRGMVKSFQALVEGIRIFLSFGPAGVRDASRTFPSAYELLPHGPANSLVNVDPFTNNAWATAAMRPLLSQAASVLGALPLEVPVRSCFVYGTHRTTPHSATLNGATVTFAETDDGDGTVARESAMGQGLTNGGGIARFPIPFGRHSRLPDDEWVLQKVVTPRLLGQEPEGPLMIARFRDQPLVRARSQNSLRVEVVDQHGSAVPGVQVSLSILGTNVRNRPLVQDASGSHHLNVSMASPGETRVCKVRATIPGNAPLTEDIVLRSF